MAHDLHSDYASTRYAIERAARNGGRTIAVQHHHAHLASCMADNAFDEPVIGVTFDGTGFGLDGAIWGGEFLVGDFKTFRRAAHFRYVRMPGGEQAIREPWRMALAYLGDANEDWPLPGLESSLARVTTHMIGTGLNSPWTSSCGRWLDAMAAILGGRHRVQYEGQAAIELEELAGEGRETAPYPFELRNGDPIEIDLRPVTAAMVRDRRDGVSRSILAQRVHNTLVEVIAGTCWELRQRDHLRSVALSGGVFCNARMVTHVTERLRVDGFDVFTHSQVPPNDGGLALGQAEVAAAQFS